MRVFASAGLNVKSSNHAAIALYERAGMREKYLSRALRFPWLGLGSLPAGDAVVGELVAEREAVAEREFDLPKGQLAHARRIGRLLCEARSDSELVGVAAFDPKFPGAFPFRVRRLDAVAPLLTCLRQQVPNDEVVHLVAEGDEALAKRLLDAGATVRDEIVHFQGTL